MTQLSPDETDLPSAWPQLAADIAQAVDHADLDRRTNLALGSILPTGHVAIVWAPADGDAPDPAAMARLRAGLAAPGLPGRPGYIPVRCGAELDGWVRAQPGSWSAGQEQALALVAAIAGLARRSLRPAADKADAQRAQLREQIARARDTLILADLLDQLNLIAQRAFGCVSLLVALRYQRSGWFELAYLSLDGVRLDKRAYWEQRAGLTGAILQTDAPIFTDDYPEECARRNVPPLYVYAGDETRSWMGAPLRDGEGTYGVISCYMASPEARFSAIERELFLIFAEETARPIRNAQLLLQAEQQARQMQALSEITRAITSTLDPKRVPALIIEQAQELFNAEEGSLLLLDEKTGELVFSYAGGPAGYQLLGQRLPSGAGVAGYVATSGQPAVVNNARGDGRFYSAPDGDTGFLTRSLIAVPLRGIDGVKGVIEILNRRDDAPFTEEDRALLESIADQAMIALENAHHFAQIDQALARRAQELDRSNDRLRRILRVSNALRVERNREDLLHAIAQAVSESAGFRSAVIALAQRGDGAEPYLQRVRAAGPAAESFERLRAARAPLSRLLALLRPEFRRSPSTYLIDRRYPDYAELWGGPEHLYTPDIAPGQPGAWHPRDAMFSLLRNSRGEVLGLICVSDPEDGLLPGPEQVQILDIFANQAAVALENAQLYSDLQHSLNSMTALNGLGMALNTTLRSPQEIYELTVGGMVAQSEARWGVALLWQPQRTLDGLILGAQIGSPADQTAVDQLAREAILLRRPQSLRPGAAGGEPVVAIPLRATRGILGAICIGYAEGLPDASGIESLGLFANQAAVAVESLQLFNAVRRGRDQLASIMASTREGMLLVDEASGIAVANDAFRDLVEMSGWPDHAQALALEGLPIGDLLTRWQAAASYSPVDLELLYSGIAAVADGLEPFVRGQLNSPRTGARALEWSILRATPEGESEGGRAPQRWPILITLRDITAAKEAERLRQDLTNMMVHDLRSPLTSVITSIDMIFRGTAGEATQIQRDILSIAYASTQHLLDMVNLLLDISRLESGQMPLECAPTALRPLIERAISRMTIIAHKHQVTIDVEAPEDELHVVADRDLILRVLQNLLDNALKFSPKGERVLVHVARPGPDGSTRIAVRDFGMGIKPRDLEKIFVKFGQVGNRRSTGSGLGLTFCKLVVEAHSGAIGVESTPGEGSTFFFTLPVAGV